MPSKYMREADADVKLTTLVDAPDLHKGRLVILGGVILEEEMREGRSWLHTKNHRSIRIIGRNSLPAQVIMKPDGMG